MTGDKGTTTRVRDDTHKRLKKYYEKYKVQMKHFISEAVEEKLDREGFPKLKELEEEKT